MNCSWFCPRCNSAHVVKDGSQGKQRHRCKDCDRVWTTGTGQQRGQPCNCGVKVHRHGGKRVKCPQCKKTWKEMK